MYIYLLTYSDGIGSSLHDVDFDLPTISCISFSLIVSNSSKTSPLLKSMWFVFAKVLQLTSNAFHLVYEVIHKIIS